MGRTTVASEGGGRSAAGEGEGHGGGRSAAGDGVGLDTLLTDASLGTALAGVFAWLRPNDLVWNYWVNDYLLGKDPPPFDILYWNADTTNMPAALHRDFVEIALSNALSEPGVDSGQAEPASAVATAR